MEITVLILHQIIKQLIEKIQIFFIAVYEIVKEITLMRINFHIGEENLWSENIWKIFYRGHRKISMKVEDIIRRNFLIFSV